jgi:enolase
MNIKNIRAHEILDSKGDPTIEVMVTLDDGTQALGGVPSGASTGTHEAFELRDNDQARYMGKGVLKAVENVNTTIQQVLVGQDAYNQTNIDNLLIQTDGTPNKSNLGGNAMVGVSIAVCRAAASSQKKELYQYFAQMTGNTQIEMPLPMITIMEGGKHGSWATDIQEFMLIPHHEKFPTLREKLRVTATIFQILGKTLDEKGYDSGVGFEGAYAPKQLQSNREALELIMYAIHRAGFEAGSQVSLAIDVAASEFFEVNHYVLKSENSRQVASEQWADELFELTQQFPLKSIEDPFHEEEWQSWQKFTQRVGQNCQVVGDDLVTTNVERIQRAIDSQAMNATLIKLNQIGTVSETLNAISLSTSANFASVISHRGGETNDDTIADLVVGTTANQCKFGGPDRGERLAKYNRLLRIENQLLGT